MRIKEAIKAIKSARQMLKKVNPQTKEISYKQAWKIWEYTHRIAHQRKLNIKYATDTPIEIIQIKEDFSDFLDYLVNLEDKLLDWRGQGHGYGKQLEQEIESLKEYQKSLGNSWNNFFKYYIPKLERFVTILHRSSLLSYNYLKLEDLYKTTQNRLGREVILSTIKDLLEDNTEKISVALLSSEKDIRNLAENLKKQMSKKGSDFAGRPLPDTNLFQPYLPNPYDGEEHENYNAAEILKKKQYERKIKKLKKSKENKTL